MDIRNMLIIHYAYFDNDFCSMPLRHEVSIAQFYPWWLSLPRGHELGANAYPAIIAMWVRENDTDSADDDGGLR